MTRTGRSLVGVVAVCLLTARLGAQITETPMAFDSAGRVRTLTPALVARLELTAPAWPVEGAFREARLFASIAGLVLAVERPTGSVDRFVLPDSGAALRAAVNAALARTGALATEEQAFSVSEPARGHFLRTQLALAWGLYGPLLASMTDDTKVSSATVLFSVPASFVIVHRLSRNLDVTRAQSGLAFDGALRGWGVTAGALYAITGEAQDTKPYRFVGLVSAIGGSVLGFRRGRSFTDGEAQATTTMSNFAALTAFGLLGTTGAVRVGNGRAISGTVVGAGLGGYLIGPRYARQPGYSATRGDVQLLHIGATLGVMTALTPVFDDNLFDRTEEQVFGLMTGGMLGGVYLAHRAWVRPYQHSTGDAMITGLGATAGGLAGMGLAVLSEPSPQGTWAMITGGAILGAMAGHRVANPARASGATGAPETAGRSPRRQAAVLFTPGSLALAAAGVPGHHAALSVRF